MLTAKSTMRPEPRFGDGATVRASTGLRMRGLAAIAIASVAVAVGVLVSKRAVATLPVLPVVFLQVLSSAAFSWVVGAALGRLPHGQAWRFALPGVLQPGLAYMLTFAGLALISVSVSGLLYALETVLVVLLAWPLLRERPSGLTLASAAVATIGVVLVTQAGTPTTTPSLLGILLTLAGVSAAALDTIATRRLAETADPVSMTVAVQTAAVVTVGLSAPFWPLADLLKFAKADVLLQIILSGILIHAVAALLFIYGLRHIKAGVAATVFPVTSLITVMGGLLYFQEPLSSLQAVGGALVVLSAFATAWCVSR